MENNSSLVPSSASNGKFRDCFCCGMVFREDKLVTLRNGCISSDGDLSGYLKRVCPIPLPLDTEMCCSSCCGKVREMIYAIKLGHLTKERQKWEEEQERIEMAQGLLGRRVPGLDWLGSYSY